MLACRLDRRRVAEPWLLGFQGVGNSSCSTEMAHACRYDTVGSVPTDVGILQEPVEDRLFFAGLQVLA